MQPFYAATDILVKIFEDTQYKIRNDKRYMQICKVDENNNSTLLAQLFFNPSEDGYRAFLMVHEDHWQAFQTEYPKALTERIISANLFIQVERAAFTQGSTRTAPSWHLQYDPMMTSESVTYPLEQCFQMLTPPMAEALREDPYLLQRGRPSLLNFTTQHLLSGQVQEQGSRFLPPKLQRSVQDDSMGVGFNSKGKGSSSSGKGSGSSYVNKYKGSDSGKGKAGSTGKGKQYKPYTPEQKPQWQRHDWSDGGGDSHGSHGSHSQWKQSSWSSTTTTTPTTRQDSTNRWNDHSSNQWQTDSAPNTSSPPMAPWNATSSTTVGNLNTTQNKQNTFLTSFILGITWCTFCSTYSGMGKLAQCKQCSDSVSVICSWDSCGRPLGSNPDCDLCRKHFEWTDAQYQKRQWIPEFVPMTSSMEFSLHKHIFRQFMVNAGSVDGIYVKIRQLLADWWQDINQVATLCGNKRDQIFQLADTIYRTPSQLVLQLSAPYTWTTPTIGQFMAQGDPNLNYPLSSVNISATFDILTLLTAILTHMIQAACSDDSVHRLLRDLFSPGLVHTGFLPLHSMVQASWNIFHAADASSPSPFQLPIWLDRLRYIFQGNPTMATWGRAFSGWLVVNSKLVSIFLGRDPYTNSNVKLTANPGSQFFDTVTVVAAHMLSIGNLKRTQEEAAANAAFVIMYDYIINNFVLEADTSYWQTALARHWNNKGNSMETLMLCAFDQGRSDLVWLSIYICLQVTYAKTAHANIVPI